MEISIQKNNIDYNPLTKTFTVSGKETKFATTYDVVNDKTGKSNIFFFDHSTGSEWDVNTIWVYKSVDGFTLNLTNSDLTQGRIDNYVEAKTRI